MKKIFGILVIFASFVFGADVTELQKACEGGDNRACIRFVSFNKDEKVNLAILQNSCDNNYLQACDWLGSYYEEGISVKKDDKKAFMLYKQACNGGNDEGCGDLGLAYYSGEITSKDEAKGKELLKKACSSSDLRASAFGCYYITTELKENSQENITKAQNALKALCDSGEYSDGCSMYGWFLVEIEKYDMAKEILQKACDGGEMDGCISLGVMYDPSGNGVEKDFSKAVELYKKACDGGNMHGCRNLVVMYTNGNGVEKD